MGEWKEYVLEDCMDAIIDYRGKTPKKTSSGVPLITAKIIKNGSILPTQEYIAEADYDSWMRRGIPKIGDVLLTTEAPLGEVAQISDPNIALAQRVITLRGKKNFLNNDFLKYLLISPQSQAELSGRSSGTTVLGIKQSELRKIKLRIPEYQQQEKIAVILKSLDDKIELNRKMNETLEEMARAIFKSWFVDFDPVHAKARGEKPAGMPDEIADLFPSEFVHSDQLNKPIPKGWEVAPFKSLLKSTIGGDWGKEEKDSKHTIKSIIIRGTDMPSLRNGERSKAPLRWVEEKKLRSRKLEAYDIVIEISGGSPTQPTGRSILITPNILERFGAVVEPASFCRKFSAIDKFYGVFASFYLDYIYAVGKTWDYQNQSTGISNFQTTVFLEKEFLALPNKKLLEYFFEYIEPITDKMTSNESIQLAELRDSLLPKLISGEIEV